ncbi:hypothetical protein [Marinobacter subterrani]|uniref:hypothetical protein n=1 Tax=Marinobacter subterrani TaxID=1658765 RepID=UPI002357BEC9|nr:hypothetical protein [Marinobacter subterrani]
MSMQFLIDTPFQGRIISTIRDNLVEFSGLLYNDGGADLTFEEYKTRTGQPDLRVVNDSELDAVIAIYNQETYLDAAPQRITFQAFMDKLECLPPCKHEFIGEFERFNMIERITGTITEQVVRRGKNCISLYVDSADRTTWVTPENFDAKWASAKPIKEPQAA